MRVTITLLFSLFFLMATQAQDTLTTVVVQGFRDDSPVQRVAGGIEVLGERELRQFDNGSLLASMNRLPGVRFEQRAPGSYRISVRGSTLRSPFGVRNIKVYWNGIPYTEPGGDTQLNFLDLDNIDRLELIKGPSGSLYGAGTAGTLLLETDTLSRRLRAHVEYGTYNSLRAGAQVQGSSGNHHYQLRLAHQSTDGYRDHSKLDRQTVQLSDHTGVGENGRLEFHALYTNLHYDLPGGLNPEQFAENPRQARPGSAETNASINYENLLLGTKFKWKSGRWSNTTSVYATGFYFDHPFNFDYKRETNLGAGGRSAFDYTLPLAAAALKLSAGFEVQTQQRMANNFGNEDGRPSELNFSDEITSNQNLLFGQATYDLGNWKFTAGMSLNTTGYRVDRTFDAGADPGITDVKISGVASPRLALLHDFGKSSLHASFSRGFSPPTLDEFRTNEGSLNTGLSPERGDNYEIGYRAVRGRLRYDLTAFLLSLDETITSYQDDRGTQLFRNAGSTDQRGLEASIDWLAVERATGALRSLRYYGSFTYHDFTYGNYEQRGEDYTGNRLPGTAPFTTTQVVSAGFPAGFYADLYWNFTDAIPLNDGNTVYGEAYNLVRARVGWRGAGLEVYLSGDNLLDERFSLGNDLNPQFGNRYYQPAADRTVAVGVRYGF